MTATTTRGCDRNGVSVDAGPNVGGKASQGVHGRQASSGKAGHDVDNHQNNGNDGS